jgi:uncharacterized protein YbjQ (UPF0145 family)
MAAEAAEVAERAGDVADVELAGVRVERVHAPPGDGLQVGTGLCHPWQSGGMLITTMNDLPGYEIEEVLGEVFGLTVRSRNVGSQIGASFKSLVGGELKGMTKQLAASRVEAQSRLVEEAEAKGGNAIVAFRFDTSELGSTWTEICAYGTAVRAVKR